VTVAAPALAIERDRMNLIGVPCLGIVGDVNHKYGYHLDAARLFDNDASLQGSQNRQIGPYACAIDVGMGWFASRLWLAATVRAATNGSLHGVAEIIGSVDGKTALYWSPANAWVARRYTGADHIGHSHISIYRVTAEIDHKLFLHWTKTGYTPPPPKQSSFTMPASLAAIYGISPDARWIPAAKMPALTGGSGGPEVRMGSHNGEWIDLGAIDRSVVRYFHNLARSVWGTRMITLAEYNRQEVGASTLEFVKMMCGTKGVPFRGGVTTEVWAVMGQGRR
jgi:hypothetical protein